MFLKAIQLRKTYKLPFFAVLMAALLCMLTPNTAQANPKYASLVMDANTGMILYQRYADKSLHPASLTKMMTLLMAFEALDSGKLRLHDKIYISSHAASQVPSKLDLPKGSYIRVEDAIYALVTKSANDVAVALGEKLAGTESNFALKMTYKAKSLGMTKTRFYNASGLHHPRQVTTARDMAILARYIINSHPNYYKYFSTRHFTYRGKTYRNHNRLLGVYDGMDGMKTGYIRASGFNLVASAKRGDRRIIGVVFGGRSSQSRNAHMKVVLDRGFNKLDQVLLAAAKKVAPKPEKKPQLTALIASTADDVNNAVSQNTNNVQTHQVAYKTSDGVKWADFNSLLENTSFSTFIGEGDFDPAEIKRFKTGLIAINAVKNYPIHKQDNSNAHKWAIQLGAFKTQSKTQAVIEQSKKMLPANLDKQTYSMAPIHTRKGTVYRARLTGYSESEAIEACSHFKDCLPIRPRS